VANLRASRFGVPVTTSLVGAAAAMVASAPASTPWIDLRPPPVTPVIPDDEPELASEHHPIATAITLGSLYAGFSLWAYFAWYRGTKLDEYKWGGDGLFEVTEYAGGADKLGHAWATMALGRGSAETLIQWGGFGRTASALIGAGLAELVFLGVEIKDGYYYQFSYGDLAFNTIGAGLAAAMTIWPKFDAVFDFRVEYWPSSQYRAQFRGGNVNVAEDYSGETYLAALHLGGFDTLREWRYGGTWTRFVDLAVGFGTKGYKPDEPDGTCPPICYPETQHWYAGISVNAQGVFDWLFERRAPRLATVTHGLFEILNVPFGFVPLSEGSRMAPPRSDVPTE